MGRFPLVEKPRPSTRGRDKVSICLAAGSKITALAISSFTLSWTHSVQKTEWREDWVATQGGLQIIEARIKGSGAGMEPGDGARLIDGWWVWSPQLGPQRELALASSGTTGTGWRICHAGGCDEFGIEEGQALTISICP